jgi:hypothetical protein
VTKKIRGGADINTRHVPRDRYGYRGGPRHSTAEPRRLNDSTVDMTKNRPMIPAKLTQITR